MRQIYAKKNQQKKLAYAPKKALKNKKKNYTLAGFEPGTLWLLSCRLTHSAISTLLMLRGKFGRYIQRVRKIGVCAQIAQNWRMHTNCAQLAYAHKLRKFDACTDWNFAKLMRKFDACVNACVKFAQIIYLRNCANCANFGADLQPCALKNHYFAPHITGFRAVGKWLQTKENLIYSQCFFKDIRK